MWKIAVIIFKEFTWKNSDGSIKMSQTCLIECIIKCFGIQRATTRASTAEHGALSSEKGEETGEEVKALHETGEQINELLARFLAGELCLKARPQRIDRVLHLGIRAGFDQLCQIGGILLGEHPRSQNLGVQFRARSTQQMK